MKIRMVFELIDTPPDSEGMTLAEIREEAEEQFAEMVGVGGYESIKILEFEEAG